MRGEPHDLALFTVLAEAEVLRDGGHEDADRVREERLLEHHDVGAAAGGRQRRAEVAEDPGREQRRLGHATAEVGAGAVRERMLDRMHLGADLLAWQVEAAGQLLGDVAVQVGPGGHRHVVEVGEGGAGGVEARAYGERGEAGRVLHAGEARLLGREHRHAVAEQHRRRVGVIGVEAEDQHRWGPDYRGRPEPSR